MKWTLSFYIGPNSVFSGFDSLPPCVVNYLLGLQYGKQKLGSIMALMFCFCVCLLRASHALGCLVGDKKSPTKIWPC